MKKNLFSAALVLSAIIYGQNFATAQNYRVHKDSVIAGDGLDNYSNYTRSWDNTLMEVIRIDAIDNNNSTRDTATYNGNGTLNRVDTYWLVSGTWMHTIEFIYDGSLNIIRTNETGDNGGGVWTKSFDISYNGANEMTDIQLDALSISGSPEGMMANFENLSYTAGNLTYLELIGDMGMGIDTYELSATHDMMNPLGEQLMITETPDLLLNTTQNNLLQITFVNDENIANSGDLAIDRVLSYDANNNVVEVDEQASEFTENPSTTRYMWENTAAVKDVFQVDFQVYPNPVTNEINLLSGEHLIEYEIRDLTGQLVQSERLNGLSTIDINLPIGLYILNVNSESGVGTTKFIVK